MDNHPPQQHHQHFPASSPPPERRARDVQFPPLNRSLGSATDSTASHPGKTPLTQQNYAPNEQRDPIPAAMGSPLNNIPSLMSPVMTSSTVPSSSATVVLVEQRRAEARQIDNEFQHALRSMLDLTLRSTRRLGMAYGEALAKTSELRSTVTQLQDLVSASHVLHSSFDRDAEQMRAQVEQQIDGFAGMESERKRIEELEERVRRSAERSSQLDRRLEEASRRVKGLEVQEDTVQKTISWRFRICYGVLGIVVLFLVALTVLNFLSPVEQGDFGRLVEKGAKGPWLRNGPEVSDGELPKLWKRWKHKDAENDMSLRTVEKRSDLSFEDPRLELFDEL